MVFSFESLLGPHPQALMLRSQRSRVLATNLAHADTPGFKARDMDFARSLAMATAASHPVKVTHPDHLESIDTGAPGEMLYRLPLHPSLDGNTVTTQIEQAEFTENALRYQASLLFLNRRLAGIKAALQDQ